MLLSFIKVLQWQQFSHQENISDAHIYSWATMHILKSFCQSKRCLLFKFWYSCDEGSRYLKLKGDKCFSISTMKLIYFVITFWEETGLPFIKHMPVTGLHSEQKCGFQGCGLIGDLDPIIDKLRGHATTEIMWQLEVNMV